VLGAGEPENFGLLGIALNDDHFFDTESREERKLLVGLVAGRSNFDHRVRSAASYAIARQQRLIAGGDEREVGNAVVGVGSEGFVEDVDGGHELATLLPFAKRSEEPIDPTDDPLMFVQRCGSHMQYALPHFVEPIKPSTTTFLQLAVADLEND